MKPNKNGIFYASRTNVKLLSMLALLILNTSNSTAELNKDIL